MKPQLLSAIAQMLVKGRITKEEVSQMQIDGAFEILLKTANVSIDQFKKNERLIDINILPSFLVKLQEHIEDDL